MPARSAGILLYRRRDGQLQVLLAHPGGPFWRRRDLGSWTIPKGETSGAESPESAARREFREELGVEARGTLVALGTIRQRAGKLVEAFALEGDFDPAELRSNTFEVDWPPHAGTRQAFPEVDRVAWLSLAEAREKILPSQIPLLERLEALAGGQPAEG
jgi:predicted NUDIX family NTP pyrophosphohydrolase